MDATWTSIVATEYKFLKNEKQKQLHQIWNKNQSSVIVQRKEASCMKWNMDPFVNVSSKNSRNIRNVFMLTPQTRMPPTTEWSPTPRNFKTKDIEDVSGVALCDSNENEPDLKWDPIDDEMFVCLVQRMISYQNSNISISSGTTTDNGAKGAFNLDAPAVVIFQTINAHFKGNYTADKYMQLTKHNTPSCTPNIDEPMEAPIQPDQSLRAYRKYFCRRCCIYNCQLHPLVENVDGSSSLLEKNVDEFKPTERCSSTCFLTTKMENAVPLLPDTKSESITSTDFTLQQMSLEFSDLSANTINQILGESNASALSANTLDQILGGTITNDSTLMAQSAITQTAAINGDPESEWDPSDQSLFLVLRNIFPYNCCAIAMTMRKPCVQVYKKMALTDPPTRKEVNKKSSRRQQRSKFYGELQQHLLQTYSPCNHTEPCNQTERCLCQNCEKYCSCDRECRKRFPKCSCKSSCITMKCICYSDQRECDADCECQTCKNKNIQVGSGKKLKVMTSSIHGWGVTVAEPCQKGDFISEYKGEIISNKECERREKVYNGHCTYSFTLNGDSVVDARFFGNKLRFINHSVKPNCYCKVMMVNGDHRIGVYAARDITAGEEITINYISYDPTTGDQV